MARQQPLELFMPPNLLKAKVGGNFVGVDMAAINRAEAAMESLKDEFSDWTQEDVRNLVAAHEAFADKPDAATDDRLLRAAHDMKGQAVTFNYPLIAQVAGSLSRLIHDLSPEAKVPLPLVDAHVNAINVIYRDKMMDKSNKTALALIEELEARVGALLGG